MIKTLRKKISLLFTGLLVAIMFLILLAFNWQNYSSQLREFRAGVRLEIREGGWNVFLRTGGDDEAFEMESLEYCIVQICKNGTVNVVDNHFSSMTVEKLKKYAQTHCHSWKLTDGFSRITYISKYKKQYGKIFVLLSTKTVIESMKPVFTISLVIVVVGIFVLAAMTKKLSFLLVRPVEEAMQSEKDFISNASHELKTPLTVIRANIELLGDEIGKNKRLQYIDTETKRLISLVNKMLELVRLDARHSQYPTQNFRVDEALLNVIYPMESVAFEKGIRMDIHVQDEMYLTGNEEQIQSLMAILTDNAISYTPTDGGVITIDASIRSHKFYLSVSNTGETIPPQQCEKLFERFYRQDQARESTSNHLGMGLSIAESIVRKHHGKIYVKSVDGINTFYVTLPILKK